jgi:outer membrane protein OmpU
VNYSDITEGAANYTYIGVGVGYETGAIAVEANYAMKDFGNAAQDVDGFGLAAAYDLGGGAKVQAGFGTSSVNNVDTTSYSLGIAMSF